MTISDLYGTGFLTQGLGLGFLSSGVVQFQVRCLELNVWAVKPGASGSNDLPLVSREWRNGVQVGMVVIVVIIVPHSSIPY